MDPRQVAENLFPCWCLAIWMMYLIQNSEYKDLLKISKEGLIKFAKILSFITVLRIVYLQFIVPDEALRGVHALTEMIPWQPMLGVFWEDMIHTVPLVLLSRMMAHKKWFKYAYAPLVAVVSMAFGMGHAYEGPMAVLEMTLYIPITMRLAKKYGFGTVMLCHMAYDLATFFTLKSIAG